MSIRPSISIVITSYNYEKYIGECILSALNQTYAPLEVIVVDDGSIDKSIDIIRSFEPRVSLIAKKNGGQGSSINVGFAASRGDIVCFLDSDDCLDPNFNNEIASVWRADLSRVSVDIEFINSDGAVIPAVSNGQFPKTFPSGDLLPKVLETGGFSHPPTSGNVFSRKYLSEVLPLIEGEWITNPDIYLSILSVFFGKSEHITKKLCLYRFHQSTGALTTNGRINGTKLKRSIDVRLSGEHAVKALAKRFGHEVSFIPFESSIYILKDSLVLAKLENPKSERYGSVAQIAYRLCKSIILDKRKGLLGKAAAVAWVFLMTVLPRRVSEFLAVKTVLIN